MDFVIVYTANGQLDAEMIRGFIEASGIPAMISQESVGKVFGLASGPLGEVNILVPEGFKVETLNLLEAMERGDFINDGTKADTSVNVENEDEI